MMYRRGKPWIGLLLCVGLTSAFARATPIVAQSAATRFELADAVQLDRVDNAVRAQLERVEALLADRQWDEAVEILRQLAEASEDGLLGVTARRFVDLRDWCQMRLASLPPEALKLYRGRVDPVARQWYEQGIAERDPRLLQQVVDRAFASSYGDDALMALGEIYFESGNFAAARWCWQRIVPTGKRGTPVGTPVGAAVELPPQRRGRTSPRLSPCYPDTDLDLAAVRARLVLASILEGATDRARAELAQFARLHPDAQGRLGDRRGKYVNLLNSLLADGATWPPAPSDSNWLTFAGNPRRNKTAVPLKDVGAVAWRLPCASPLPLGDGPYISPLPLGEGPGVRALCFHPLVMGNLVLVNTQRQILAVRLDGGKPAWGRSPAIYRSELAGTVSPPTISTDIFGSPRFTMTVFRNRLYARMGSPLTGRPHDYIAPAEPGCLVCLDLAAEGRLLWKITPDEGWTFEGTPVADRQGVYVAIRRLDVRPQALVACLEADTGRLRWRRFICGAETPARGTLPECSHNLLTLAEGMIYYNTNLGAVAALRADDGRLSWVSLYPRALSGDFSKLAPHWRRELNPCLFHRGTLLVAPVDSPRIFAFDAAGGQLLWQTGTEVEDALGLLGTTDDHLIAAGGRLFWIGLKDEDRGRVKHVWPEGPNRPGYGRGVLAGPHVLWSTGDKLYIFDLRTAQPLRVIDLALRGATGGNLLTADGKLLIATDTELIAIGPHGGKAYNERESAK